MARVPAYLAVVLLCCLVLGAVAPPAPKPPTGVALPVPHAVVDLDLPPRERWGHIIKPLAEKDFFQPIMDYIKGMIPPHLAPLVFELAGSLDLAIGKPWGDEIRGVAEALQVRWRLSVGMGEMVARVAACVAVFPRRPVCVSLCARVRVCGPHP